MSSNGLINLPVYKKSLELRSMSRAIAICVARHPDLICLYKSESLRDQVADSLIKDTVLIPQQIALAANTSSIALRERSLHFVHIMTRNLASYCKGLEMEGVKEREYLDLLRRELKLFRKYLKSWHKSLGH